MAIDLVVVSAGCDLEDMKSVSTSRASPTKLAAWLILVPGPAPPPEGDRRLQQ